MIQTYDIAIYACYQTLQTIADYTDSKSAIDFTIPANVEKILAKASQLALPNENGPDLPNTLQPLQSIMGHLHSGSYKGYYLPQCISNDAAMPLQDPPSQTEMKDAYRKVWRDIQREYKLLEIASQPAQIQEASLYALLQRYAWAIPAPVSGVNDVSYFDYTRVRAALAVCLADQESAEDTPALLVGADLSGVQEWLYTLSSTGAAKSLRGRSVYLQLLMEVIALDMLHTLELPTANLLYVGGGNFYMAVPVSYQTRIEEYQKTASRRLLDMHQGALYMALAATPLNTEELQTNTVGNAWRRITPLLSTQKMRRFAELGVDGMAEAIGTPLSVSGNRSADRCVACHRPIAKDEWNRTRRPNSPNNPDERIGPFCESVRELGRDLSEANYLVLTRVPHKQHIKNEYSVSHWQEGLEYFGFNIQFPNELENEQIDGIPFRRIFAWDSLDDMSPVLDLPNKQRVVWSFRPLAQCVPLDHRNRTATFDDLHTEGIQRWGALRMDVDRLGNIFQKGIAPASLSRTAGLSGLMRLFFEGYVPTLAEKYHGSEKGNPHGEPRIQLMYAGGDDLFVVGGWSWLPHLAVDIHDAFTKFACGNPAVTISGGISLAISDKYPLYQAVQDAGHAEEQSKDGGRNAITFLNQTLPWKSDSQERQYESYEWVDQRVKEMATWLQSGGGLLPRSFIMNLREIDAEWREWTHQEQGRLADAPPRYNYEEKPHLYLGPWQWHLVYRLKRVGERTRDKAHQENIRQMVKCIINGEIFTIGLSARWLELLTRQSLAAK